MNGSIASANASRSNGSSSNERENENGYNGNGCTHGAIELNGDGAQVTNGHTNTNGIEENSVASPAITYVHDKYVILEDEVVGRGAWSVVKRCKPLDGYVPPISSPAMRFVAKIIEKAYLIQLTKGDVERAMGEVNREIDVLRSVPPHPNIVTFVESIETQTQFLLIFEEVQCGDLCELILQAPDARLSEERSQRYTYQTIKAVLHCHTHDVIHRDIKPENLLVNRNDDIQLTDFGLAKRIKGVCTASSANDPLEPASLIYAYPGCERLIGKRIVCSDVIGTPRYGAPEMFYAKFTQTHYDGFKADTWSVGVVAYITLSGSFPYSAGSKATEKEIFRTIMDTPLPPISGVSALASDFVQRILNKDPSKRMTLYEALDHPWLESCIQPRGSVTVPQLLSQYCNPEVQVASQLFEEEARALHLCMSRLRREIMFLKDKERQQEEQGRRNTPHRQVSPPRRAETPTSAMMRNRPLRSPASSTNGSARVSSPRHNGIAPGRVSESGRVSEVASRVRRPVSASRITSGGSTTLRSRTPLARSTPHGVRRGTPVRAGFGGALGASAMPSAHNSTMPPKRASVTSRSMTPSARTSVAGAGTAAAVPTTPTSSLSVSKPVVHSLYPATSRSRTPNRGGPVGLSGVLAGRDLMVGDSVTYKGNRAVVRFNGPTTFGAGVWIGLEMLEGNEGTNDGSSFIDKKQYFSCPKGKGAFVRASQVKKVVV